MKHVRHHTRRQWVLIGCAMALLGTVAIVPWRVVAQEAKSDEAATPSSPAEVKEVQVKEGKVDVAVEKPVDSAATTADDPSAGPLRRGRGLYEIERLEKLLTGTWRGGHSDGEVVFREGGLFEEFPQTLTGSAQKKEGRSVQGRWSISPTRDPLFLQVDVDEKGAMLRGLPKLAGRNRLGQEGFVIRRLDEKLLRLDVQVNRGGVVGASTLFFRRVDDRPATPKFDPDLSEEIRKLAMLAELTPEEAKALAAPKIDWLKEWKVTDAQMKMLERVAEARRGKIDLAELFELSKDEAAAFSELYVMTDGNFEAIKNLAGKEQLTPTETAAVKKLLAAKDELEAVVVVLQKGTAQIVRVDPGSAPEIDPKALGALAKVYERVLRLWNFTEAAVFTDAKQTASDFAAPRL